MNENLYIVWHGGLAVYVLRELQAPRPARVLPPKALLQGRHLQLNKVRRYEGAAEHPRMYSL